MRLIKFFLPLILICMTSTASFANANDVQYSNAEYGFAVKVPAALHVQKSEPPAPDHGIAIDLSSGGRLWIDASYDASFLGSAKAALSQIILDENIKPAPPMLTKKLAGLEAAEISFRTKDRAAVRIVIFRSRNDAVPIIYTLGLDTYSSHVKQDKKLLNRVIRSFSLLPLPK